MSAKQQPDSMCAMRRTRVCVSLCLAAALVAGGVVTQRWWHNRPPYPASALHATAELHPVSPDGAQAFLGPDVNAPLVGSGGQLVAGTITWNKPPTTDGYFSTYVIDKRTDLKPRYMEATSSKVSAGGNSWDNAVATKYPWLTGAGDIYKDGSWWEGGCDLMTPAASGLTRVTFVAVFPNHDPDDPNADLHASAPVDVSDLLVVLVFTGTDNQIFWAQRLYG
jgi:hypothetical protein